jgi:hypothetical protein
MDNLNQSLRATLKVEMPLIARLSAAETVVGGYIENREIDLYRLAKENVLEGIIAKRKTSTYRPGKRFSRLVKDQGSFAARFSRWRIYQRQKGPENISERCYWSRIETGSSATSAIREPVSVRKDWQKRSID